MKGAEAVANYKAKYPRDAASRCESEGLSEEEQDVYYDAFFNALQLALEENLDAENIADDIERGDHGRFYCQLLLWGYQNVDMAKVVEAIMIRDQEAASTRPAEAVPASV